MVADHNADLGPRGKLLSFGKGVVAKADGSPKGNEDEVGAAAEASFMRAAGADVADTVEVLVLGHQGVGPKLVREPALVEGATGGVFELPVVTLGPGVGLRPVRDADVEDHMSLVGALLEVTLEFSAWVGANVARFPEAESRVVRAGNSSRLFRRKGNGGGPPGSLVTCDKNKPRAVAAGVEWADRIDMHPFAELGGSPRVVDAAGRGQVELRGATRGTRRGVCRPVGEEVVPDARGDLHKVLVHLIADGWLMVAVRRARAGNTCEGIGGCGGDNVQRSITRKVGGSYVAWACVGNRIASCGEGALG